jgi:hypothetical protein
MAFRLPLRRLPSGFPLGGGAGDDRSRRRPAAEPEHMMKRKEVKQSQDLVGIVISGMPREEQPSVFSAYVWGPAPAMPEEPEQKAI